MRALPLLGIGILLASCPSWSAEPPAPNTARARYAEALAGHYAELFGYAESRAEAPAIAAQFHQRAARVLMGERVDPEIPRDAVLGAASAAEARRVRAALVTALQHGAADRVPLQAAKAQASFDCWIAAFPPETGASADCKRHFYAAMAEIEPTMTRSGTTASNVMPAAPASPGTNAFEAPPGNSGRGAPHPSVIVTPSTSPTSPAAPPLDPIAAALLGSVPNGGPPPPATTPPMAMPLPAGAHLDQVPIAGWIKQHSDPPCRNPSTPFNCIAPEPNAASNAVSGRNIRASGGPGSGGGSGVSSGSAAASASDGAGAASNTGAATSGAGAGTASSGASGATGTEAGGSGTASAGTGGTGTGGPGAGGAGAASAGSAASGTGGTGAGAGPGSAGTGSAGTGSAGTGSAGTGSAGTGSAGTGGTGSAGAGAGASGAGTGAGSSGAGSAGTGGAGSSGSGSGGAGAAGAGSAGSGTGGTGAGAGGSGAGGAGNGGSGASGSR